MEQQNKPIILFPDGAPGETEEMEESEKLLGIKIAGTRVLGVKNVSEPAITFYPAPKENNLRTAEELIKLFEGKETDFSFLSNYIENEEYL